jgi:hypothetical protein
MTDTYAEIPWRGCQDAQGMMYPPQYSSHPIPGSSQDLVNATTTQQSDFGPRGQVTHQTGGDPYSTKSGSDTFDRPLLKMQMREEQLARHRLASGFQDESVVTDDAPGYAYMATMNM